MIIQLEEDPITGELILPLPDQLMKEAGWEIGDTIQWKDLGNGSWSMSKVENTQLDPISEAVAQLWEQVEILKAENSKLRKELFDFKVSLIGDNK